MSEKVKAKIFEIVVSEKLYFNTTPSALCGVIFKISVRIVCLS